MTALIYGALAGLGQEGILWGVALLLGVFFILGLLFEKFSQAAPALMTSLGILGTFCGIFIALYPLDFSPERINDSIEELLNGMTTAFVTSLLGIFFAIVFRIVNVPLSISISGILRLFNPPPPPPPTEQQEILNRLDDIRKAIAGDGDSSMVTQMQKLRDENRTGFEKMEVSSATIRDMLANNMEKLSGQLGDSLNQQREMLDRLDGVRKAISGGDDSSIVMQMQKLRDENRAGFETIRDTLAKHLEALAGEVLNIIGQQRENLDRLENIRKAIAGDEESSMAAQMQKLRDENRAGFEKLDGLAEIIRDTLAENLKALAEEIRNTIGRQLGESLQQLIASIEKALIEQFGKTFVEFNEATQALKKWQEDHRAQVEQLTDAFNLAANGVAQIAGECEKIPSTMEQLRQVVETARGDVESLTRQLEAFAALRQQAEGAFPVIKNHLDKIGEDLQSSARGFDGLEKTIQASFRSIERESQRAAEQHAKSMGEMSEGMRKTLLDFESETRKIAKQHSDNVRKIAESMRETLQNAQSDSAKKVTGVVEGAIEQFSKKMHEEIDRVARAWGGNLVSIAEKAKRAIDAVEKKKQ